LVDFCFCWLRKIDISLRENLMQNVARGFGFGGGLASLILACAMATPAVAVEVPQTHVPLPNVHIAPPKIAPPKITAPKSHVHAPTQPTRKGNALHPPKGLQQNNISNAPTGGGNTTGDGVKVLQGTPASPQTNPGGGTTTGGEAIGVNKQIDQPSLQRGNATGGGVKVLEGTPASPQTNPAGGTTTGGEAIGVNKQIDQPSQGGGNTTGDGVNKQAGQPAPASGTPTGGEVNKQVGQPTPTGGGTQTGGGVKVDTQQVNQPSPPGGGTTIASAPIVDLKTLLNALQQSTPPGGGTSNEVSVSLETLRDLLQQCKAGQASPSSGCILKATRIDPAQIQSVITELEQNNAAFNSIIKRAARSSDPASSLKSYIYKRPSTGNNGFCLGVCWPVCSGTQVCGGCTGPGITGASHSTRLAIGKPRNAGV
jgi:hypothetical protein